MNSATWRRKEWDEVRSKVCQLHNGRRTEQILAAIGNTLVGLDRWSWDWRIGSSICIDIRSRAILMRRRSPMPDFPIRILSAGEIESLEHEIIEAAQAGSKEVAWHK